MLAFQSPSTFYRAVIKPMIPLIKVCMRALGGVDTNEDKGNDMLMNSRGRLSLMIPKVYIGIHKPM